MVYCFVLSGTQQISLREHNVFSDLTLMLVSKDISEEAKPYYFRCNRVFFNNAQAHLWSILAPRFFAKPNVDIRHIGTHWESLRADSQVFKKLATCCPFLETLEIRLGHWDIPRMRRKIRQQIQTLHQDNDSIKNFNVGPGFDSLVKLRGLKSVVVYKDYRGKSFVSDADVFIFEKFLNVELRKPKEPIQVSNHFQKKSWCTPED